MTTDMLSMYIYGLSIVLALFVIWVVYSTRARKEVPKVGTSAYKYTGPKPSLVDHDPGGSQDDKPVVKYVKYVPATHLNRHTRRYMAKLQRSGKLSSTI